MPGGLLAAGDSDGYVSIWNIESGKQIGAKIRASGYSVLTLSQGINNTQLVGGFDDAKGKVWATNKEEITQIYGLTGGVKEAHKDSILALQVVSEKLIATASADYTIK